MTFTMSTSRIIPISLLLSLALSSPCFALDSANPEVTVTEASRTVDLTSQLVKETVTLTLHNGGSGAVRTVHVAVAKDAVDKIAFVGATVRKIEMATMRM